MKACTCKNCNGIVVDTLFGLKNFCTTRCRNEYRRKYLASKKREERERIRKPQDAVNNKGGYVGINLQLVNNTEQELSTLQESKKLDFETEFGTKETYLIAKECCNFPTKAKDGYCVTLHEPYFLFKTPCRDCGILKAIANRR